MEATRLIITNSNKNIRSEIIRVRYIIDTIEGKENISLCEQRTRKSQGTNAPL
jgi:hypothetical protein